MTTLESYLTGDILRDRADIAAIESVLRETASTVAATFNGTHWPYEVIRGVPPRNANLSQSTTAMMIRAIDLILNAAGENPREPSYAFELDDGLSEKLLQMRRSAAEALTAAINPCGRSVETKSRTYGRNDPLTLSFLAEIFQGTDHSEPISIFLKAEALRHVDLDPARDAQNFFDFKQEATGAKSGGNGEGASATKEEVKFEISVPLSNAFIPLRVLRTCHLTGVGPSNGYRSHLRYFESTLHDQLSFISIPDSRFDPAELAFCLEGMLRSSWPSVDVALFSRILEVLKTAQENSAHWRPTKPFLRNERGLVLFPLSVEAANALLRSCGLLDQDSRFDRFTGEIIRLLRRFWEWLTARRISFPAADGTMLLGWHSEHVADVDSIQLWDTAQVVEFLLGYRHRLRLHMAHTTLRLARFDVRTPAKPKVPWSGAPATSSTKPGDPSRVPDNRTPSHGKEPIPTVVSQFEPVTTLGLRFETYRRIGEDFVGGWLSGQRKNYSMLLYGPPGTGKTSVAENIGNALGFPLITITVSDFLAEGGGAVEARAKMIFEVLEAQADCVVLFDEIDELLLDRSSARHSAQETVFKFMTPGMLTKLNNLRRKQRVIFILATNYAYRIDPAIRRTGRIDENYLLLPPDVKARKKMLLKFLRKNFREAAPLSPEVISEDGLARLSRTALFLGYKDIEAAVARVSRQPNPDVTALDRILKEWSRTTTLEFYRSAFSEVVDTEPAEDEFLPLVQMAIQEDPSLTLPADFKNKKDKPVFESVEAMRVAAEKFVKGGQL